MEIVPDPQHHASAVRNALFAAFVLAVNGIFLNSLFSLFLSGWFTAAWYCNVILTVASFLFVQVLTLRFDSIVQRSASLLAKSVSSVLRRPSAIILFYFIPYYFIRLISVVVLGSGLYHGAVYYSRHMPVYAYFVSLLTWMCWCAVRRAEPYVQRVQVAAESMLDGRLVSIHNPRWGSRIELLGMILSVPAAVLTISSACYCAYAFFLTESLPSKRTGVALMIVSETITLTTIMLADLGGRIKSQPVLSREDVDWDVPTGLLLRSFSEEDAFLGARSASQTLRMVSEFLLRANFWPFDGAGRRIRWLAVVRPGQHFVTPGIQRIALTNECWQPWVAKAVLHANLIVIFIGRTGGLKWELCKIVEAGQMQKVRVIVLPENNAEVRNQFFEGLSEIADLPKPDLPKYIDNVLAIWWENGVLNQQVLHNPEGPMGRMMRLFTRFTAN